MEERKVRVRFAPSPTGPLHMGGVRTALYNYLFAKKHGGDFLLRIEDTDQGRFVPGAEEYIVESLAWCGLKFDEGVHVGGPHGPYRQSERKPMYRQYAEQLVASGHAYYAFDTTEELDAMRERLTAAKVATPQYNSISRESMKNSLTMAEDDVKAKMEAGEEYVIRIKMPRNEEVRVLDIIRGWVVVNTTQLDDKVLFKSDGMPTYHLANVVDDYLMNISHVIRGEEWLPSAPLHVLLYRFLGWEDVMPQFAHLPLLLKPDGNGKLSKRDGDRLGFPVFPMEWKDPATDEISSGYKEKGYLPEAFVNMLAFLGWNPGTTQEIFSLDELIAAFSLERVSKSGAKFDPDKTRWFQQQYLRAASNEDLAEMLKPYVKEAGLDADMDYLAEVCGLMKEKAAFVEEIWDMGRYFFYAPDEYEDEVVKKRWKSPVPLFIDTVKVAFDEMDEFNAVLAEETFKETAEQVGVGAGQVMQAFRMCVSGVGAGPALWEMVELLGQEEVVARLAKAVKVLGKE